MGMTDSQKKLKHKLRNGQKIDPRGQRGSWQGVKPVVRVKENRKKDDNYDNIDW